jgi:hypothetical protein
MNPNDRAKRVLEQLDHLRDTRRAHRHDCLDDLAVERDGHVGARLIDAADDLGNVVRVERRVAGIHALG